ncbi:MAG: hypothetical protein ACI8WB_005187 [Phenylobacterium sp.]|jgi:hypothetical protein
MGSYAYDFLNDSFLLDESLVKEIYEGITETELSAELMRYREHCLKHLDITSEQINNKDIMSCLATDSLSRIQSLKQAALYVEQVVVQDPIFSFTAVNSDTNKAFTSSMGLNESENIDRTYLAANAHYLILLRPFVSGGFVKIYPVSLELERGENLPIWYSENGYEDSLPRDVLSYYKKHSTARSARIVDGQLLVRSVLERCRHISVTFNGSDKSGMLFLLQEGSSQKEQSSGYFEMKLVTPKSRPTRKRFEQWVKESINRAAIVHYEGMCKKIGLSQRLVSLYSCEHELEWNLLNMNLNVFGRDIQANTFNSTMQMDLPFLDGVSAHDLMSIRNNDGELFQSFRAELEKSVRSARHEQDPIKVQQIIEDAQHELFDVQTRQIAPLVNNIRKTHFAEAGIGLVGLGASIATSGASLFATLLATLSGVKTHSDYLVKVQSNPCHFLWKVKNKAKPCKL